MPVLRLRFVRWLGLIALTANPLAAQWTHRYPKIQGMSHHVYLEGYELPSLTIGPIDPAVAPGGKLIAFASRGWLWVMDPEVGTARRITKGAGIDARPTWRPDGKKIAFVRDDTRQTTIVELDVATGEERVLVDDPAINLDPRYAPDGASLFYSSASAGDLDIWRLDLGSRAKTRITTATGSQELDPVPLPDGQRLVYLAKTNSNEIRLRNLATGEERTLLAGPILSMLRLAAAPDNRTIAFTWPASDADGWELKILSIEGSSFPVLLTSGHGLPLTPAWTGDGKAVIYAEADRDQRLELFRVSVAGGKSRPLPVSSWDWGVPTGRVRIETRIADQGVTAPARLSVVDGTGHPLVPDAGQPRFDGQNGVVFFYSGGTSELTAPLGSVTVQAVQGLATPVARGTVAVGAEPALLRLALAPVWDPRANGWLAGEHHFHLNYGGLYRLPPDVLAPMARAEGMDILTPLLANLHTRFEDQPLFDWHDGASWPVIAWGQEVRSHFLGHIGLTGTGELFWPWIWGPGYEVHGRDDRANAEVLAFARRQGGISSYVHPVIAAGPFTERGMAGLPVELVADGVLGEVDALEVACLWSDEIGSMEMWYRLLDIGVPIALSAGTDVMNNFYRTMAVGTTRLYVKTDPAKGYRGYLDALKAGRSFVTNGPLLDFTVSGAGPGAVLARGGREVDWALELHTAVPIDSVEIVVNGTTVTKLPGSTTAGSKHYQGKVRLPAGGWIAARALGGPTTTWPAMDSYGFGHTGPLWIGERGSTLPSVRRAAATELKAALQVALGRLRKGYEGTPIPNLEAQFAKAAARLDSLIAAR